MYVRYGYMQMFEVATGQLRSADVIYDPYIVGHTNTNTCANTNTNTALSRTKDFLRVLRPACEDPVHVH